MIKLSTRTKLAAASVLSLFARAFAAVGGANPRHYRCRRRGIQWELDLYEGIPLSIFLFGFFERDTVSILKRLVRPGMVVLDIGSNVGAHTLPLAQLVGERGKVIAVEPTRWAFTRLCRNLELNAEYQNRVVPVQVGLIRSGGTHPKSLVASWDVTTFKKSESLLGGTAVATTGAKFMTLDDLFLGLKLDQVDLLKLDVDGYEVDIIAGGARTLGSFRPPIVFEMSPIALKENSTSPEALFRVLEEVGYEIFTLGGIGPMDLHEILRAVPSNGGINFLAVHRLAGTGTSTGVGAEHKEAGYVEREMAT